MRGPEIFCSFGLILVLATTAWATNPSPSKSQLTVYVSTTAHSAESSLLEAERETARVFRNAGIGIDWINCTRDETSAIPSRCHQAPGPAELVIRIIPRARQTSQNVTGSSFLGPTGGVYADIFFDRVLELQQIDPALSLGPILGDVIAHELGHLLLGGNSHSQIGLMQPTWKYPQLRLIEMGQLRFSPSEAAQLRERISLLQSGSLMAHQDSSGGH